VSQSALRHADRQIRRVAVLSVHTSPLEQPGSGDAGGLNVYVDQTARRLARRGIAVDVFTRATASEQPPCIEVQSGYTVRHVLAGPYDGLAKSDLPGQLCSFAAGVLRAAAPPSTGSAVCTRYDVVHSHYWLSGQVGYLVRDRWGIPQVHSAHTLAKVKNSVLEEGEAPEPTGRVIGEQQVVAEADLLLAGTEVEAGQLVSLYGADPARVTVVHPGVDVELFAPADRATDRAAWGLGPDEVVIVFAGRIQPHKGPVVVVNAVAALRRQHPGRRFRALIVGDSSGQGHHEPARLRALAAGLGVGDIVQMVPAMPPEGLARVLRAADVVAMPSRSESFGLVALEAQACGTPVVASAVGGLPIAVRHGVTGLLVDRRRTADWAQALAAVALDPARRARMATAARAHAVRFSWETTVDALLAAYRRAGSVRATAMGVGA
jgi:D-inositol-3-phosphate glycosyltransferase